jgi:hypothetical protein
MALIKALPIKPDVSAYTLQGSKTPLRRGVRYHIGTKKKAYGRQDLRIVATLSGTETTASKKAPVLATIRRFHTIGTESSGWNVEREYENKHYWVFEGRVYETRDLDLTPEDVLALVNEAGNRRRLQLEKAHALQAMTQELAPKAKREPIRQEVKIAVWQRDGGRCVACGSNEELEFDHIIPLAMGGANTLRNLQLLCATCNRRKGATLG